MKISIVRNKELFNKVWIKRKDNYKCGIALQAQNHSSDKWYVDGGFSKHMTSDKDAFVNIEKDK